MIIYKITNTINGKIYIGQTIQKLNDRFYAHKEGALKGRSDTYLARAIRKYGKDAFKVEEIYKCNSREELGPKEVEFILKYNSFNPKVGYNMKYIVDNKLVCTEEWRKKASERMKKRNALPENKIKNVEIGKKNRGKLRNMSKVSKYVGVSLATKAYKDNIYIAWSSNIYCFTNYYLGRYKTEEEAAQAYDIKALELYGEIAILNFPENKEKYLMGEIKPEPNKDVKTDSAYYGVHKKRKRWYFRIVSNGVQYRGNYDTELEAALAYDEAISFNGLNKPLNFS